MRSNRFYKILGTTSFLLLLGGSLAVTTNVFSATTASVPNPFTYTFSTAGTLYETSDMALSSSPYFWLNSGAKFILENGVGKTIQGALPTLDSWRLIYNASNPLDTENGYFPQNLLRLVTRSTWQNVEQQISFRITRLNMTESPNRNASNGVLLMSRYQNDGQTLYYAGIRADGNAIIKKKRNGVYTTLASKRVFADDISYDADTTPNLLPGKQWMKMKSIVEQINSSTVRIRLYLDKNNTNSWELIAEATDASSAITQGGFAGIRTDFMDVEFDNYTLKEL